MIALEQSIEKWKKNAEITDLALAKIGSFDCPLCHKFFDHGCWGCPVMEKTGRAQCRDTLYYDATEAIDDDSLEDFIAAAKAEVAFLEGLRK